MSIYKFPAIANELNEYSSDFQRKFMEVFPCKEVRYCIPIPGLIIFKGRQVGQSPPRAQYGGYVTFSSEKDFWDRWERFKGLKAFL